MEHIWIDYEHVSERRLGAALSEADTFVVAFQPGRILVASPKTPEQLQELVWGLNNGAYCSATVADEDDIQDLL